MTQTAIKDNSAPAETRPFILDPVFRRVTELQGIGPKNAKHIERLCGGERIIDLLSHFPIEIIDRRLSPAVKDIPDGRIVTLKLQVEKHIPSARRNLPYKIRCRDDTGTMDLVFFHASRPYLEKQMPEGSEIVVSGRAEHFRGRIQIVHPDAIGTPDEFEQIKSAEPLYPLTAGLTNKVFRKAVDRALNYLPDLPEWLGTAHIKQSDFPDWKSALRKVHCPRRGEDLLPGHKARARLAYDELLANQLALALVRLKQKKKKGRSYLTGGKLRAQLLSALPFELTAAQHRSISEIDQDMQAPLRMMRLLQGDVGAGKTVVAALTMLNAIQSGAQAAIMAPTEILARQHESTLAPLLDACGISYVTLTGRDKGKKREQILDQIKNGSTQIVMGTHALFQQDVAFADLGVAVIDEQHRFGVHQRLMLAAKGRGVDVLVMTATPIPRTLSLTAYGDMDVSRLDEKPPGRKPVDTRLISNAHLDELIERLSLRIKEGQRIYWVCPLVEESEVLDLAAAEERFDILKERIKGNIGLVHGRMKARDKDEIMNKFAAGEIDILVATTVIEVGVNVPEATIMVIEHAERFGLAQLHQLRGRVGRGADQSYCFLLYGKLTDTAKERLSIMRDTEDGFLIAEKDLELRGAGEILGVRQSGLPIFRMASLPAHDNLLAAARDDAKLILEKDPHLESERGQALRLLLYLYERDQAIQFLHSG
jgi:ATP-dependent DNA helicase RecG